MPKKVALKVAPRRRARKAVEVEFIEPMRAQAVPQLPDGSEWSYEVKWDGYRLEALKIGDHVRLLSRNAKDLTRDFPLIADAVRSLPARTATIDGEVVALDESGRPSFQLLQHRASAIGTICYYAFDLLHLNGRDLCEKPLDARKTALAELVAGSAIRVSPSLDGELGQILDHVRRLGLEGVVAKRRTASYAPGNRASSWVKLKLSPEQEFVIGGFKPGSPLESIVVGYYEGKRLLAAGAVRNGLTRHNRRELADLLAPLIVPDCPFQNLPNSRKGNWGQGITAEAMNEFRWVTPKLIAQVAFTEWTRASNLRHAAFKGLRTDKHPREIVREHPS